MMGPLQAAPIEAEAQGQVRSTPASAKVDPVISSFSTPQQSPDPGKKKPIEFDMPETTVRVPETKNNQKP